MPANRTAPFPEPFVNGKYTYPKATRRVGAFVLE